MMHGRRINPLPGQVEEQMKAAAPIWAEMRRRQELSKMARKERQTKLWEGLSVGDVVILSAEVTKRSYGLNLSDDQGEAILMDGVLVAIEGDYARVRIGRTQGKMAPGRGPMIGELQVIGRSDIKEVSSMPPSVWGNVKEAMTAAAARDGRKGNKAQFWSNE